MPGLYPDTILKNDARGLAFAPPEPTGENVQALALENAH